MGRFGDGCVLMINPCAAKGLAIFLGLADLFPKIEFAGLAGWGTTSEDRAAMSATPNVRIIETVPKIDDVLSQARILLMPSLWYEGFGLIAMEAMLRGIPVIASDSGGLVDAKAGAGYVIPVRPITQWTREFDDTRMPVAVIPDQDIAPWRDALHRLLSDEKEYWRESEISRTAAGRFVAALDAGALEKLLARLIPAPPRAASVLDRLSAEDIALLRRKLRGKKGGS